MLIILNIIKIMFNIICGHIMNTTATGKPGGAAKRESRDGRL